MAASGKKAHTAENTIKDPADEIVRTYIRVYSETKRRAARLADRHGVTLSQLAALRVIHNGPPPVFLSDIGEKLHLNQSAVTGLIDRMEREGLAARERSDSDRRKIEIRLTARGEQLARAIPFSPMDMFRSLFNPLTPRERQTLLRLMRKVSESLFQTLEEVDVTEGKGSAASARSRGG